MTKRDISNSKDTTLEINTIKHWEFLMGEYLLIKDKKHPRFAFVQGFYDSAGRDLQPPPHQYKTNLIIA